MGSTEQLLTLEVSLGGGIVTDPFAAQTLPAEGGNSRKGGGSGSGSVKLTYSLSGERMGINASNVINSDYYPQAPQASLVAREVATFAAYFAPFKSTRVTIGQTYKDLPDFSLSELFEPDFGQVVPPDRDLPLDVQRYRRYGTTVDISQALSTRTRAGMNFGYGHGMVGSRNWTSLSFGGNASQQITKGVGLHVGYAYGQQRSTNVVDGPTLRDHHSGITGGVDFNRALSFTRRTKLSFSTGTAATHDRVENRTTYHLVGGVSLKREFGQTGNVGISYGRGVRYIESLAEPLLSNSLSGMLNGSFSRRLSFRSSLGASLGHLGASGEGTPVDTYSGSVQVSFALTRYLALATNYGYYRYSFGGGTLPIADVGQRDHQSVHVLLQLWAPLMTRTKKS